MKEITAALVGNPNSGKSTLFNRLSGGGAAVGNRAGVTVSVKKGLFKSGGRSIALFDLPGVYAVSPFSPEERVTYDFLKRTPPDVILNVIDCSALERGLYLTTYLSEFNIPIVIVLNMADVLQKSGRKLDTAALEKRTGCKCIAVSARYKTGIEDIQRAVLSAKNEFSTEKNRIFPSFGDSAERYRFASSAALAAAAPSKALNGEKADRFLLGKLGVLIFWLVLGLVFSVTFGKFGAAASDIASKFVLKLHLAAYRALISLNVSLPVTSLVCDGIIDGVGGILSFLPQMFLLFLCTCALEDIGYLPRMAFLADRALAKHGLGGNCFLPLFMGFGCTASAVMAARTIKSEPTRKRVLRLLPYCSCAAKIPVYIFVLSAVFKKYRLIISAIYLVGIAAAFVRSVFWEEKNGSENYFVLELPAYRFPNIGTVLRGAFMQVSEFLKKAGGVLLLASVAVWFLKSFTPDFRFTGDMEKSLLAAIGKTAAPFFSVCGWGDWRFAVALISGLLAKEAIVSTLSVVGCADILSNLSPVGALAFCLFVLLYTPCAAALAAYCRETGSLAKTVLMAVEQFLTAYGVSFVFYSIASCIFAG